MEQTDRIAALEEEVSLLKGEIKSILQEVRVALLSRENPFAGGILEAPASVPPAYAAPAPVAGHESPPPVTMRGFEPIGEGGRLAAAVPPTWSQLGPDPAATEEGPASDPLPRRARQSGRGAGGDSHLLEDEEAEEAAHPVVPGKSSQRRDEPSGRQVGTSRNAARTTGHSERWNRRDLAALMAWTQEVAARFSRRDFVLMLSIARYGGLIDGRLQQTLVELSGSLASEGARPASMMDFALAAHQLEAVLGFDQQPDESTRAA
jgi:hypothetical protein